VIKRPIQTFSVIIIISLVAFLLQVFLNEPCIEYTTQFTCLIRDNTSLSLFFLSFHTFLMSTFTLAIYLSRGLYLPKLSNSINSAIRQGFEISLLVFILLQLNQQNLLEFWSGLLTIVIFALIEMIIISFTEHHK